MALYHFLRNSVLTLRFQPHTDGFDALWAYYYDKPIRSDTVAPEEASAAASSHAHVTPIDYAYGQQVCTALRHALTLLQAARGNDTASKAAESITAFLVVDETAALGGSPTTTAVSRAPAEPAMGSVKVATWLRSVLELFVVPFVGAPRCPDAATFSKMATAVTGDHLIALGVDSAVTAVLVHALLPAMLRRVTKIFGLHSLSDALHASDKGEVASVEQLCVDEDDVRTRCM